MRRFWESVWVWRVLALTAVLAGVVGTGWHSWRDHQALHQMIGYWNVYGPLLEQARKTTPVKESAHGEISRP